MATRKTQLTKQEKAAVVRVIGTRMREARELCNMSLSEASKRLGYANPSKLSKVELASDTNSVPLWLVLTAARVYDVSLDYLCGMSGDWEVTDRAANEREISEWLHDAMENMRRQEILVLKKLHDKLEFIGGAVSAMLGASSRADDALRRFAELNPGFEDMRGGAALVAAVGRSGEVAVESEGRLRRFRRECTLVSADVRQLSLAL